MSTLFESLLVADSADLSSVRVVFWPELLVLGVNQSESAVSTMNVEPLTAVFAPNVAQRRDICLVY